MPLRKLNCADAGCGCFNKWAERKRVVKQNFLDRFLLLPSSHFDYDLQRSRQSLTTESFLCRSPPFLRRHSVERLQASFPVPQLRLPVLRKVQADAA